MYALALALARVQQHDDSIQQHSHRLQYMSHTWLAKTSCVDAPASTLGGAEQRIVAMQLTLLAFCLDPIMEDNTPSLKKPAGAAYQDKADAAVPCVHVVNNCALQLWGCRLQEPHCQRSLLRSPEPCARSTHWVQQSLQRAGRWGLIGRIHLCCCFNCCCFQLFRKRLDVTPSCCWRGHCPSGHLQHCSATTTNVEKNLRPEWNESLSLRTYHGQVRHRVALQDCCSSAVASGNKRRGSGLT
jgi:hypothetical protein